MISFWNQPFKLKGKKTPKNPNIPFSWNKGEILTLWPLAFASVYVERVGV